MQKPLFAQRIEMEQYRSLRHTISANSRLNSSGKVFKMLITKGYKILRLDKFGACHFDSITGR